jgi:hypothetical protein
MPLCGFGRCVDAHTDWHRVCNARLGATSPGPGLTDRTISCPGCGSFKTHRAVCQHQGRMAKSTKWYEDLRRPIPSAWSSCGARVAGRAEDLSRCCRLPGMTYSDTDSNGERSPRRMDRDDQPARAASPQDAYPANPGPADHLQVKIQSYTVRYSLYSHLHIHQCTYHIHTYAYIYIHIHTFIICDHLAEGCIP